ncbi:DUF3293 domain-containing protein [Vibrio rotiferianus]|uniref:DUF3293 domain-containing protein n=1 Tax=Vibrio rotiferianus TaxID=190895 RepID=UPI002893D66D|nr:conserved hypothetical protein [Vibrio rotiferianus]CAH1595096.1 conserved hypothetical protein [Vibrio rotiferianus]
MIEKSNTNIDAALWHAYSESYFRFEQEWSSHQYAVITAWNPYSKLRSNKENCISNHELEQCLKGMKYVPVTVGDRGFQWFEESYAVEIKPQKAIALAKIFKQNAIYYVVDGELHLISCVGEETRQVLGEISDKLV